MKILYGCVQQKFDVTDICVHKLMNERSVIHIPSGSLHRAYYFNQLSLIEMESSCIYINDVEYDETCDIFITCLLGSR